MSSKEFCSACLTIQAIGIALQASSGEGIRQPHILGTALGDAVPGEVGHRRVAQCDPTVPRENSRRPSKGCSTPVATVPPRTLSRLQPFVATDWKILLRPGVGEGRNNVLKRI